MDIVVVGGGHAGAEAAHAAARMGLSVAICTLDPDRIAEMSCNPSVGGLAKGQLAREVDALGGLMGRATDATGIQFRMLNASKGPAVRSPRAQCDRPLYQKWVQRALEATPGIHVAGVEIDGLWFEGDRVAGVVTAAGAEIAARAVILTTGTFLKGLMHTGETRTVGGRFGERSAERLSDALRRRGFEVGRLKTGTPPRLLGATIDFRGLREQRGDEPPPCFSFITGALDRPQRSCFETRTSEATAALYRANLHRAPMYSGQITSAGPRYCPSLEDKFVRFPDKPDHLIFLEPESNQNDVWYPSGISTSMPAEVQDAMLKTIPGLRDAKVLRHGYAVEYDYVPAFQCRHTLETKAVRGLFMAGQINGTSGYEEAAALGIVAGVNAALKARGEAPFILRRDESYIGVLVDDLVTREIREPYRMFTSRAEYRLTLRQDNADRRLTPRARRLGLVDAARAARLAGKEQSVQKALDALGRTVVDGRPAATLLRAPEATLDEVAARAPDLRPLGALPADAREQIEIEVKYAGFVRRQQAEIEEFRRRENTLLPETLDYRAVPHLSLEAREKLGRVRPRSVGQALRVPGVNAADVAVLLVHVARRSAGQPAPVGAAP
ncbi:MAG: tRNA uridine-5-carboxymethylaminomethyl(34) synthesis enzyme MnmG [Planctomycetes bacterium]|nr:tRNA uridine-5-carboxymethylaminomethyl(34) synthesis enzyme MnmG [Planctomycetota bacterium]